MMAAVHDSTNSSLVNKLFAGTLARRSNMLMVETELRTAGVFVNVSSQYSRIEPGNISIADSNMGLLFVVVAVQLFDAPASAALSAEKERSAPLLLQDDDDIIFLRVGQRQHGYRTCWPGFEKHLLWGRCNRDTVLN